MDAVNLRVISNAKNRLPLNKMSKIEYGKDGSLTRYFALRKPDDAPELRKQMNDVGITWMLPFAPSVTETTAA